MELFNSLTLLQDGGLWPLLQRGGPVVWLIVLLSIVALTVVLWKVLRFWDMGVWRGKSQVEEALALWRDGETARALDTVRIGRSIRAEVTMAGFDALARRSFDQGQAEAEIVRVAKARLTEAGRGLKLLDVIATVAPLLGLLGTVIGMIAAFQAMQAAGAQTDAAALAGGIWEALLTTAAGMAVAIPVTMALGWFEAVTDRLRLDLEDIGTRVLQPRRTAVNRLTEAAE